MTHRTLTSIFLVAVWHTLSFGASAQGTRAGYERAKSLQQRMQGKVTKAWINPHWYAHGTRFWYRNDLANAEREFIRVDAVRGVREPAFDHGKLAAGLAKASGKPADAKKLPIESLAFDETTQAVRFTAFEKHWHCNLGTYEVREQGKDEKPPAVELARDLRPSSYTGPAAVETFVNQTGRLVKMFWSDPNSRLRPYGSMEPGASSKQNTYAGHVWVLTDEANRILAVVETPEGGDRVVLDASLKPGEPALERPRSLPQADSPKGTWEAFTSQNKLHIRNLATREEIPLQWAGAEDQTERSEFFWSPDNKKLLVLRTKPAEEHKIYLIESSPASQVQPKLHSMNYLKPGDRIAVTKPHLFDIATHKEIPIDDALFTNPWSLGNVRWQADSKRFTFEYNQRGHQVFRVIGVNAQTGTPQALVEERISTFVDYAGKHFARYLDETGELIWMSERDGWNHLYLYDLKAGAVKNQITQGEWVVRRVERVDTEQRQIWFWAGGIRPGQDPYYLHFARVNFDGSGLVVLTEGDGTHTIQHSPDRRFFVDTYSRVDAAPATELRAADDGRLVCPLEEADFSALKAAGWQAPEPFVAKGRDGITDIYGIICRPTNFDAGKKYPVIENIYAGPQDAFVPKVFHPFYPHQALAELGFIVVQIDGMGTSNRSKRFHDVCWKNLADAGLADRILWLKAAAQKYPSLDLTRVGIFGGSAGGQNALTAMLSHGDFYKVAVADCGCHDNRMDKIWWNELWMGWPIGPHYAEQSNVTNAHKLQGKLLLIVGELDRNVDPASTMQVANALVKANKDFDLLVLPGVGHGAAETPYGQRRRQDFFVRHLLGVEPRSQP